MKKPLAITLSVVCAFALIGCDVEKTREGNVTLPKYDVNKTQEGNVTPPKYDVTPPDVKVSKEEKTIDVPKVETEKRTVEVPNIDVKPAKDKS